MKRSTSAIAAGLALGLSILAAPGTASAQDYYVGQLQQVGTNWCPNGWHRADGTLLSIAEYSPLYSLIGTTFGGDGVTTFAVPDLRDRAPVSHSTTLPNGAAAGTSSATLTVAQMPMHTHAFNADPTPPAGNSPYDSMLGVFPAGQGIYAASSAPLDTPMNPGVAQPAGGSSPVEIQMPALATNWCIAVEGVFPQQP